MKFFMGEGVVGSLFFVNLKNRWINNIISDIISDIISNNTNEKGGKQWIKRYMTAL